jgi:hypothetical protein
MSESNLRTRVRQWVNLEQSLLYVFLLTSGYMLWETTRFSIGSAARFPRLVGAVVFIGTGLLLLERFLPETIRRFVAEDVEIFSGSDAAVAEVKTKVETEDTATVRVTDSSGRPLDDTVFTGVAVAGYAVLGYMISIFLATPIFVFLYTRWYRMRLTHSLLLTVLGAAIAYGFYLLLNVPLLRGEVFFTSGVFG